MMTETYTVPSTFVYDSNTGYNITLPENIGYSLPYEPALVVRLNGLELEPSNQSYYVGDNITTEFSILSTRVVSNAQNIKYSDITVLIDGNQVYAYTDYTINIGSTTPMVTFINAPNAGSEIVISNRFNSAYLVSGDNTIIIKPSIRLKANDVITVRMISTHDQYNIRCQVFSGALSGVTKLPTYVLSRPITNLNNIRVSINGSWLSPFYAFNLISPTKLRIDTGYNPAGLSATDVIVVTHINDYSRIPDIEFKIFKGINETYEYIGIGNNNKTRLSKDLMVTDEWLYVEDISAFSKPDITHSRAGVAFVNGERITFFVYDEINSRLGQLRRSTNGTGSGQLYPAGSVIHDGGVNSMIPNIVETYITVDKETTVVGKTGASKTINANDVIRQGKLWIDQGEFTPATGEGIAKSNTTQVKFLKALR